MRWHRCLAAGALVLGMSGLAVPVSATSSYEPYIAGGGPAEPWLGGFVVRVDVAETDLSYGWMCSGTLIDPSWVLTAAHCISDRATIRGGGDTLATLPWSIGAKGFMHPDYLTYGPDLGYDFGLYHLDSPAPASSFPGLADFGDSATWQPGAVLTTAGWGATTSNGFPVSTLQMGTMTVLDSAACVLTLTDYGVDFDIASNLCLDAPTVHACWGDSGAPLLAVDAGRLLLVGIHIGGTDECHGVTVASWMPAGLTWVRSMMSGGPPMIRRWGEDRYGTAAAIATTTAFTPGGTVFVASGENYPDSLAAGATAARFDAPVLLVTATTVPPPTLDALTVLKPTRVIVAGGPHAVSDEVLLEVQLVTGAAVERQGGADRYETALLLAKLAWPAPAARTVWVAAGTAFADPLIASAAGAVYGEPFVLVEGGDTMRASVHDALVALQPTAITVVGDPTTVSDAMRAQLAAIAPVVAISDADVHDRSIRAWDRMPTSHVVMIATSQNFPDALAGAAFAGWAGAPLLLSATACMPLQTSARLTAFNPKTVLLLGGPAALSPNIETRTSC